MKLTNQIRDKFIKSVMSDVPYVDYQAQAQEMAENWLTQQMNAIFPGVDIEKAKPWLERNSVYMPGKLKCFYTYAPHFDHLRTNTSLWTKLESIEKKLREQNEKRERLSEQLRGCAYGVTTIKALSELLPEFAHYLPSEATPAKMLPATTGVVDAFHAAGWPKKTRIEAHK